MKMTSTLSLLVGASCLIPGVVRAQVFSGSGTGAIADGGQVNVGPADWGTPLNVTFNVSGLSDAFASMSLSVTMDHAWIGDLDVRLFKPGSNVNDPTQG